MCQGHAIFKRSVDIDDCSESLLFESRTGENPPTGIWASSRRLLASGV